jgi:biopolymer transport protein ExbD
MPLKLNQEELPSINLTSLIDILFLLIIFFMVGTRFSENETQIQIASPKVETNGVMMSRPSSKIVYLKSDGSIQFDGQRVTTDQLTAMLVQAVKNYPDTTVQVKPDKYANFEQFGEICSAVNRSGAKMQSVSLASTPMASSRR